MQSKLEDVLKEKERELKLYQKFKNLARFCEEEVFPFTPVPLQRHIEKLKGFVESLIPEPKDRTQELFSGELFVLLCTLYCHDLGAVSRYGWTANEEILNSIERSPKTLFLNTQVGTRLGIPDKAVELVNALIFSARKIPLEWEIREDAKKAIVRNARVLGEIFNFAHLMWDIFSSDSGHTALRRVQGPDLRLRFGAANLTLDSKEGIISVKCEPRVPYQLHVLERIRSYVETYFRRFKDGVNGRLGFQYREIIWDIKEMPEPLHPSPSGLFPFDAYEIPPFTRWPEASQLLDKLFRYRQVMVVGDPGTGKTTMIDSFVMPQLRQISPNVFHAEIWERPVQEIREAIEREGIATAGDVDIASTCKKLVQQEPCFFVIDGCERLKNISADEKEKLERFVHFSIKNEDMYLIVVGDKEEFFEWYRPFKRISLSAIYEVGPLEQPTGDPACQIEAAAPPADRLKEKIDEILPQAPDERELREIVYALTTNGAKSLRRYDIADLCFETAIPPDRISRYLDLLKEKGIVREQKVFNSTFYALATRHLKEPLRSILRLDEFTEKGRIREELRKAVQHREFLAEGTIDGIEKWKERMVFSKPEMGLILASTLCAGRDHSIFLAKAEKETRGFDYEYSLPLLSDPDNTKREQAIRLLIRAKDEGVVNALLAHLRNETDPNLRKLLTKELIATGKRKTVIALMTALAAMGDKDLRIDAVDRIYDLPARSARELLIETAEIEKDPDVLDRIDGLLAKLEGG